MTERKRTRTAGGAATRSQRRRRSTRKADASIGGDRTPRSFHYYVYVVELANDVLYEARFRKCNPQYVPGKPCVYVGMTGLDPDIRFDKHKAGIQANRYVREYGLRLLPGLYECYNPMPYEGACELEVELAIGLREQGYGVWQA